MVGLAVVLWATGHAWRRPDGRLGAGSRLMMGVVAAVYVMVI